MHPCPAARGLQSRLLLALGCQMPHHACLRVCMRPLYATCWPPAIRAADLLLHRPPYPHVDAVRHQVPMRAACRGSTSSSWQHRAARTAGGGRARPHPHLGTQRTANKQDAGRSGAALGSGESSTVAAEEEADCCHHHRHVLGQRGSRRKSPALLHGIDGP